MVYGKITPDKIPKYKKNSKKGKKQLAKNKNIPLPATLSINASTKLGKAMKTKKINDKKVRIIHSKMAGTNGNSIKSLLGQKRSVLIHQFISREFKGNHKYTVNGQVKLTCAVKQDCGGKGDKGEIHYVFKTRNYGFTFQAKKGLSKLEMRAVLYNKLTKYYNRADSGYYNFNVSHLSFNQLVVPRGFKYHKNVRMHHTEKRKALKMRMFEAFNSQKPDNKSFSTKNCVVEYLFIEFQKTYKNVNKNTIINQLNEFCEGDVITNGCSTDAFEKCMEKNYKYVSYDMIGADFNIMKRKTGGASCKKSILTFFVNNSHIYPITDVGMQRHIRMKQERTGLNVRALFAEKMEFDFLQKFVYVDSLDSAKTDYNNLEEGVSYICNQVDNLNDVLISVIEETGYAIDYIDMDTRTGNIKKFKHPTKNYMICEYNDFHERERAYNDLNIQLDGCALGEFKNQSYSMMGKQLLEFIGEIPASTYNKKAHYYLNDYEIIPVYDVVENVSKGAAEGIDFYKQYATIFYKMFQEKNLYIPIYDIQDTVENYAGGEIKLGEYYIKECEYQGIKFGGYFVHSWVVQKLLDSYIITKKDIKMCITTQRQFKPTTFKKFIEIISNVSVVKSFKKIANHMNGTLKNSKKETSDCYFTNDLNTLAYLILDVAGAKKEYTWTTSPNGDCHYLKTYSHAPNYQNTSSFYRATLSCSLWQILDLVKNVSKIGRVVKVKTDAVYYYPTNEKFKFKKLKDGILPNLGVVGDEPMKTDFEERRYCAKEFKKYAEKQQKKNVICDAPGGIGKSYAIINESDENGKVLFLTSMNNAVHELREKAMKIKGKLPNDWVFSTLALFFHKAHYNEALKRINKYDSVMIDEVFMTNQKFMRILLNADCKMTYSGDNSQLHAILDKDSRSAPYDMMVKKVFSDCEVKKIIYREEFARMDKKSYKLFEEFKKTGKKEVLMALNDIDHERVYPFYVCGTNATRRKYTTLACEHFHSKGVKKEFLYQKQKETYRIEKGMPIICSRTNNYLKSRYQLSNNWRGVLAKIGKDKCIVKGHVCVDGVLLESSVEVHAKVFYNSFLPMYCSTIHKYQGGEIVGDYAIVDLNTSHFKRNNLYTSITRCKDYKHIYVDKDTLKKWYGKEKYDDQSMINMKLPSTKKSIYEMKYECSDDCLAKNTDKHYVSINIDERKDEHADTCTCSAKVLYTEEMSFYKAEVYRRGYEEKLVTKGKKKKYEHVKVGVFKSIRKQGKQPKINIGKDSMTYVYYDENDNRVRKYLRITKKKGVGFALDKAKTFAKENGHIVSNIEECEDTVKQIISQKKNVKINEKLRLSFD
jgi:hypothetical protein